MLKPGFTCKSANGLMPYIYSYISLLTDDVNYRKSFIEEARVGESHNVLKSVNRNVLEQTFELVGVINTKLDKVSMVGMLTQKQRYIYKQAGYIQTFLRPSYEQKRSVP